MKMKKAVLEIRQYLKNSTTEALEALDDTLNFIDCWLKLFDRNYEVKCGMYNKYMKNMLHKIPTIKSKPLSQGKKNQKILTRIGFRYFKEKMTKELTPLRRPKLSKKSQEKYDEILKPIRR